MIREIVRMGDPRLLLIAKPVQETGTAALAQLVEDMFDTMHAEGGVGLAAPQIGVDLQLVVFGFERHDRYPEAPPVPRTVLINPVVTPLSDEIEEGWEGCLSIPGLRGVVPRYKHIRYQGLDADGNLVDQEATGFHARVVQHEYDHLVGTLYTMRITDFKRFGFTDVLFPAQEI